MNDWIVEPGKYKEKCIFISKANISTEFTHQCQEVHMCGKFCAFS